MRALEYALFAIVVSLGAAVAAEAGFHDGRRDFCQGCHGRNGAQPGATSFLVQSLRGSDASSTCLRCHAEMGDPANVLSTDGSSFTAGGDFYWLRKTFSWTHEGKSRTISGDRHGHNVVALDYGLDADATLATSPGGRFPTTALTCISCHDPHKTTAYEASPAAPGSRSSYRLLGGIGYAPRVGAVPFQHAAPFAVAPGSWTETDRNHVAYGSGMSEWCSNCHWENGEGHQHPVGVQSRLGPIIAAVYNSYVTSGNLTGTQANAYVALVPFEVGTNVPSALDPRSSAGPDTRANVMCLTCHRAHASAFEYAGRWDFSATFLTDSHPHIGDAGATGRDVINSYYGRNLRSQFGLYQRSLCNKCHAKD